MACRLTPEIEEKRRKMRFRSGVRAFLAVGGILLLILLLYAATKNVLEKFSQHNWQKAVSVAIKSGDTKKTSLLLEKCRQEAPYVAQKAIFRQWEKELLQLLDAEKSRRIEFRKRLGQLQEKLKKHPEADFPWQEELTAIAGYAADKQELAELRTLEAQCKALNDLNKLKAAKTALKEIAEVEKSLQNLFRLTQQQRWLEHRQAQRQIKERISDLMLKYPEVPEISQRALQLKKELERQAATAAGTEQQMLAERSGYRNIFTNTSPEKLIAAIEEFRKKYPHSIYNAELQTLLNELKILQIPYRAALKKLLQTMEQTSRTARNIYIREFEKITLEELQFGTFELILQQNNGRIIRFETLSKCSFTRQDDDRRIISFTDLNNRKVQAVFSADGNGVVEYAGERLHGRMIYGRSEGILPQSFKQQTLLKIQQYLQKNKEEDFPVFLFFLKREISSGKLNLLPAEVKEKLQDTILLTEKALKAPAEQFLFTGDILKQCSENTPIFGGIIKLDGKPEFIIPPSKSPKSKSTTLWIINAKQKPHFFELGKLQNNTLINSMEPLSKRKYAVAAIPANGIDYAAMQTIWKKTARRNNLKLPPLPTFLSAQTESNGN